jgi:tetracycline 7-halogenase / FADH2 O2-dependent halogenase
VIARYDIAVVGSGFAGSLIAMIARRLGRTVILLERDRHPRFAIGESSTPLANLLLEQLADRHNLPEVRPLSKWATWQRTHPTIGCGLKRGFSFFHHQFDRPFVDDHEHRANELLVAASPHDGIADTHWYRPDVDHFLVNHAQSLGVQYRDQTTVGLLHDDAEGVRLRANHLGEQTEINARLLIDASGPRGFVHKSLRLNEHRFPGFPPTQALYAHFTGVHRWSALHSHAESSPYPPDDAAVHHVFDGGWIWILRFGNGITSAGIAARDDLANQLSLHDGADAWNRLIERFPSIAELFTDARATTPFVHLPRLSFRTSITAGRSWVMLPSAAGIIDPLLSTGIALTLLGIDRLAGIIWEAWDTGEFPVRLENLNHQTLSELDAAARLVSALYANLHDFEVFSALTLLYFAAASYSESARRLGRPDLASSFLLHDDARFGPALASCCENALQLKTKEQRTVLIDTIHRAIAPFDIAGLRRPDRRGWYPVEAEDFINSAGKLGVTAEQAAQALKKSGFFAANWHKPQNSQP